MSSGIFAIDMHANLSLTQMLSLVYMGGGGALPQWVVLHGSAKNTHRSLETLRRTTWGILTLSHWNLFENLLISLAALAVDSLPSFLFHFSTLSSTQRQWHALVIIPFLVHTPFKWVHVRFWHRHLNCRLTTTDLEVTLHIKCLEKQS